MASHSQPRFPSAQRSRQAHLDAAYFNLLHHESTYPRSWRTGSALDAARPAAHAAESAAARLASIEPRETGAAGVPIDDRELVLRLPGPEPSLSDVARAAGLNPYVFAMRRAALEKVVIKLRRLRWEDQHARTELRAARRESPQPVETVARQLPCCAGAGR